MNAADPSRNSLTPLARITIVLTAITVLAIGIAGPGSRWGWWPFTTGFALLRWGVYAAIAAVVTGLVGLAMAALARGRRRTGRSMVALVLALLVAIGVASVPLRLMRVARAVPAIHDITTDTDDPPAFTALRGRRPGAVNSLAYGGPAVAAQQHAAYPDIQPATLAISPAAALARVVAVARRMGWTIVAVDSTRGRMEASDRTRWFGFTDDIAVRVTPDGNGSRVDVRSVSRVGKSDVGTNAARVRAFLRRLRES